MVDLYGHEKEIVRVVNAGPGWTRVELRDGTVELRRGDRASRNFNPGNIEYGPLARRFGAVGSDGRFAVFPNREAAIAAQAAILGRSAGQGKTIAQAINSYAPPFENDTNAYARSVAGAIGVSVDTKMSDLTQDQMTRLAGAMHSVEGNTGYRTTTEVEGKSYGTPGQPTTRAVRASAPAASAAVPVLPGNPPLPTPRPAYGETPNSGPIPAARPDVFGDGLPTLAPVPTPRPGLSTPATAPLPTARPGGLPDTAPIPGSRPDQTFALPDRMAVPTARPTTFESKYLAPPAPLNAAPAGVVTRGGLLPAPVPAPEPFVDPAPLIAAPAGEVARVPIGPASLPPDRPMPAGLYAAAQPKETPMATTNWPDRVRPMPGGSRPDQVYGGPDQRPMPTAPIPAGPTQAPYGGPSSRPMPTGGLYEAAAGSDRIRPMPSGRTPPTPYGGPANRPMPDRTTLAPDRPMPSGPVRSAAPDTLTPRQIAEYQYNAQTRMAAPLAPVNGPAPRAAGDVSDRVFPPAPPEPRTTGQKIAAGGIDILTGLIPGVGPGLSIANAGLAITGNRTIGERVVDRVRGANPRSGGGGAGGSVGSGSAGSPGPQSGTGYGNGSPERPEWWPEGYPSGGGNSEWPWPWPHQGGGSGDDSDSGSTDGSGNPTQTPEKPANWPEGWPWPPSGDFGGFAGMTMGNPFGGKLPKWMRNMPDSVRNATWSWDDFFKRYMGGNGPGTGNGSGSGSGTGTPTTPRRPTPYEKWVQNRDNYQG